MQPIIAPSSASAAASSRKKRPRAAPEPALAHGLDIARSMAVPSRMTASKSCASFTTTLPVSDFTRRRNA